MICDPRLPERFWAKIQVTQDGCWEWTAYRDKDGYGSYRLGAANSKHWRVHRLTYSTFVRELAPGEQIDHLCRNRSCCNPQHLEPVSLRENVDRGENYVSINRKKTHCPQGHEYAGDNLRIKVSKGVQRRICRACDVAQKKAAR